MCRVLGADPALGLSAPHTAATWVFIYGRVTTTLYQLWSKIAPASWSWDKVSPSLINKYQAYMDFPVAQMVKNLPAMQETWVRSLGWKDPLEDEMAIHSSIFAWRIPMGRGPQATLHEVSKSPTQLSTHAQEQDKTGMAFTFYRRKKVRSKAV